MDDTAGTVLSVSLDAGHAFSKPVQSSIKFVAGLGIEGDAHAGTTVKHRSRVAKDPSQPNLRQVHLIHAELLDGLQANGFKVGPGLLGENVTTRGIDLLGLSRGTRLHIGASAVIEVTGLRNPCHQLNSFQPGLMEATLDRAADGSLIRKAGIMSTVLATGDVSPGDPIRIGSPTGPHEPLVYV